MNNNCDLSVALLHEDMLNKQGDRVTTSLTMIDIHDIARSCRTFGVRSFYVVHPSPILRQLAQTLHNHWNEGFGSTYNPDRKEALSLVEISCKLEESIDQTRQKSGKAPKLIATSACLDATSGSLSRINFKDMRQELYNSTEPHLLLLGTGWGMHPDLVERTDYFLEPIKSGESYNHLSVRSACAILLDRLT